MSTSFIDEIKWRGMFLGNTYGIEEYFNENKRPLVAYIGFDPTAKHLHIGNLAAIHMLRHFQIYGHKPIIVVGGGTGFIGDPAGKSAERKFLSPEIIEANVNSLKTEFNRFLNFDCGESSAEILNNLEWLKGIELINFLRDYGKFISVNEMIKRDSVKNRLQDGGISFTEFSYQVLQAYDFYWLNKTKNCSIQMGGSDQWGNIIAGIDLINKTLKKNTHAITLPLIEKKGGGKFGKSEDGNIWLNESLTSPYKFYQFWKNVADEDIPKLLRVFTFWNKEEIKRLDTQAVSEPNLVKEILADEMTKYVHGDKCLEKAKKLSSILYGKDTITDLLTISEEDLLNSSEGMDRLIIPSVEYQGINSNIDLVSLSLKISKSESRKLIGNGGIMINKKRIGLDSENVSSGTNLLQNKYLLLQKGKTYFLITVI